MDSPFLAAFAQGIAAAGIRVIRFEFPYMQKRRADNRRRGPDRMPVLREAWLAVCRQLEGPFFVGGKSMGGRVASMIVGETRARGCICLGYPFHPPGKPDRLRTEHLQIQTRPTLIIQGTRDPMGTREEVPSYNLAGTVRVHWVEDGDHSLVPRKRSGRTTEQNWNEGIDQAVAFCRSQRVDEPSS